MLVPYKLSIEEQDDLFYTGLDLARLPIDLRNNPLSRLDVDPLLAMMQVIRNPHYLHFTLEKIFNLDLDPLHHAILIEMYRHPLPMLVGARGLGKTFYLAVYILWRLLINPGIKIVVTGAGFRQSKFVFQYCQTIWNNAPVLRDLCGNQKKNGCFNGVDKCTVRIGESEAVFIPMGNGDTIRGLRAHINISDEFAAINPDIYEVVIRGFTSVSDKPIQKVRQLASIEAKKLRGAWTDEMELAYQQNSTFNQSIISGTAYYSFNHFYQYFLKYHKIISSRGDVEKLREIYPNGAPLGFDWKDFCIIRIPYTLLPRGFHDEKSIGQSEGMASNRTIFYMEFGAIFPDDSNGFYRRKLIESCVVKQTMNIGTGFVEPFTAKLCGDGGCKYIMAIDPASEQDNFAIVIIEIHPNHRRVVYCWTTKKSLMQSRVKAGVIKDNDFYSLCVDKIKDLLSKFNIELICIDTQGGGHQIIEMLRTKVEDNELPILPILSDHVLSDGKERMSDDLAGRHIIVPVVFRDSSYVSDANHGMKNDFESKILLFPYFDQIKLIRAELEDEEAGRFYDNLEDCMAEIEELKDELATIQHTQTPGTNQDKWTTPEIKLSDNKKGRQRKDRYSALLMANAAARKIQLYPVVTPYQALGGFLGTLGKSQPGQLFHGPDWFQQSANIVSAGRKGV